MIEPKHFPANKREALALLYVQSRDLTGLTPTELLTIYNTALEEIGAADRAARELKAPKIEF